MLLTHHVPALFGRPNPYRCLGKMIPLELCYCESVICVFLPSEAHGFPFFFVPIVIFTQLLTRDIDR